MKHIKITSSPVQRTWELDFDYIPNTKEQFLSTIRNAPDDILQGFGFCKWDTYNTIVRENQNKPVEQMVNMKSIGGPDISINVGRGNSPTEELEVDMQLWLIPGEWYNVIPDGFELITITGEKHLFQRNRTDNDTRFGCLAFGILRSITK